MKVVCREPLHPWLVELGMVPAGAAVIRSGRLYLVTDDGKLALQEVRLVDLVTGSISSANRRDKCEIVNATVTWSPKP